MLGQYLLGERVPLFCWSMNGSGVPTEPDQAPVALISSESGLVQSLRMPIKDKTAVTGYFAFPLLLNHAFATGNYVVEYQWFISGTGYGDSDTFKIVTGGNIEGAGLAMFFFKRPGSDYVLMQTDAGRIIRRRNPKLP